MKYVIINGSPRKKNTWAVVKQIKKSLDGEFEEIQLIKQDIPICNGCFKCFDGEENCPHFDKVNPIVEKLKKADGLIITSPVYAMNVTSLLKNYIDHTAYLYHRPALFKLKGLVVVTTAGAGHKDVAKYMDETLRHWGVNKVYKLSFACGNEGIDIKSIDKVAKRFRDDVESGKLHSPKIMDVIFYNVWRRFALDENHIERDRKYWRETGLINHDFAPEVKLGIFKKLIAKIMFNLFKKMF
ncbi:NAD(P)H-dependent oxidoreductase [Methanobrevibacter sp.]|uniref:flavodoxin family protein n=1 Tax=Methanobrevibacter sp. TaxID=66852 RepID=UPI0025F08ACB|nr:NAD(P)H-dependent oxidoreductase [Methanobrevibacter sp.]MBQ2666367.1 NAD(P)H-dependent oxidoreductase [Methanobrevibacter sp.]MBQ2666940.1 NAD(P)H-dependent oxidoreductase [Methanobrevibacter sp.]